MTYLGLDLGTKTLGIAKSDETLTIANPYKTIHYDEDMEDLLEPLYLLAKTENVVKFVLGLPKNMNNTIGPSGERVIEFSNRLKAYTNIDVVMQDERLSTVSAHNYMIEADLSRKKRKQKVDGLAASIILQTYLNIEKRKENER